jgi:hypothetical protein
LQTVESVAMALHSFLASLELFIFNDLQSIFEVKHYYDVAATRHGTQVLFCYLTTS